MQHDWEKYFDTESDYWKKVQKIYKENDKYPKVVVSGRNLHHKFLRAFSRKDGTEIDNDKENLVSLSVGDHFLVHYYLWKCTKIGYRRYTVSAFHFMYKKGIKYVTDDSIVSIAKDWEKATLEKYLNLSIRMKGNKHTLGYKHTDEARKKISEAGKRRKGIKLRHLTEAEKQHLSLVNKGKKLSEETKRKLSEAHSIKVLCVETGEIFGSMMEAQRKTGVNQSRISAVCKGKGKTAGGLHWKFCN